MTLEGRSHMHCGTLLLSAWFSNVHLRTLTGANSDPLPGLSLIRALTAHFLDPCVGARSHTLCQVAAIIRLRWPQTPILQC